MKVKKGKKGGRERERKLSDSLSLNINISIINKTPWKVLLAANYSRGGAALMKVNSSWEMTDSNNFCGGGRRQQKGPANSKREKMNERVTGPIKNDTSHACLVIYEESLRGIQYTTATATQNWGCDLFWQHITSWICKQQYATAWMNSKPPMMNRGCCCCCITPFSNPHQLY